MAYLLPQSYTIFSGQIALSFWDVCPEEYLWSTAGFYFVGKPCVIPIDDVREFLA